MQLFARLIAGAVATAIAVWLVPGITLDSPDRTTQVLTLLGVAALLAVVNSIVKPLAQIAGFCLIVLTLGLFLLVINAAMLLLVSWLSGQLGLGFHVDGFWSAVFGSIIISIVAAIVGGMLGVKKK